MTIEKKKPVFQPQPEAYVFQNDDFELLGKNVGQTADSNFASQSYWKDVRKRFVSNKGAVVALVLIVIITLLAVFGPGMNSYTYAEQDLSRKNFAPRVPGLEKLGILDGSEKMTTSTGYKIVNGYEKKGADDVYYWFGSDTLGRDIWTRVWQGTRVSLGAGICRH